MSKIRITKEVDFDFALYLTHGEGWKDIRSDFERFLAYEPAGCFIAEDTGKAAGMVTTISYGSLGWIGCLIVEPKRRGKGIGTALMEAAIGYLEDKGVQTIRLDADPPGMPLYRRFGFVEEGHSLRFQGVGRRYDLGDGIESMVESHLDEVCDLDARAFGADRSRVLRRLFKDSPRFCFVACRRGHVIAYVMGRLRASGGWIGPWVCSTDELGLDQPEFLLQAALNGLSDQSVEIGVLAANGPGLQLLKRYGFQERPGCVRMRWGDDRHHGHQKSVYGIAAAATG